MHSIKSQTFLTFKLSLEFYYKNCTIGLERGVLYLYLKLVNESI